MNNLGKYARRVIDRVKRLFVQESAKKPIRLDKIGSYYNQMGQKTSKIRIKKTKIL